MPAYMLAQANVHDPEGFKAYQAVTPGAIASYGGRFLSRGGAVEVLEGATIGQRLVLVEFPDYDTVLRFYTSRIYRYARELRKGLADFNMTAIEGFASASLVGKAPTYLIATVHVTDFDKYGKYAALADPAAKASGGTALARGGKTATLEGQYMGARIVVSEYPSVESAKAFYHGTAYSEARKVREGASRFNMFTVQGI